MMALNNEKKLHNLYILEQDEEATLTCSSKITIIKIGEQIRFISNNLEKFNYKGWQPYHYDLLLICAAVEFADRYWKRPKGWSRKFNIMLPVLNCAIWEDKKVANNLCSCLRYLTGDNWYFTFRKWEGELPFTSAQRTLNFAQSKDFVIAYSDGLDSRAVSSLSGSENAALCIRVAKNRQPFKKGDQPFDQIPFKVTVKKAQESSFRSRGFQFATITAITAYLSNLTRIIVPESGQGALGPVLSPLYNIYQDNRNYPKFFRLMEQFIKALFKYDVFYEQPRLWSTKGQTLLAFLDISEKASDSLIETRSCWQSRHIVNVGGDHKQCGLCAACLLRRLSMHVAGISEPSDTYVVSDLTCESVKDALAEIRRKEDQDIMIEYGFAGVSHLQKLASMAALSDEELRPYVVEIATATKTEEKETLQNLRTLLRTHADEWDSFLIAQGEKSFIRRWTERNK